jgi:hypothetical protein
MPIPTNKVQAIKKLRTFIAAKLPKLLQIEQHGSVTYFSTSILIFSNFA